ncbi:MAG: NAD(P)-binding protein, partial [Nitrospiraceae bacterium]|nr:NAD(P)-binding protein [Nitrospiraceae bacterium]
MGNVNVIGAGPSGGYLSFLLAKKGFNVSLFEKRELNNLGKESCTGIVSDSILNFFRHREINDVSINRINQTELFLPGQRPVHISLKNNFILDRTLFDRMIINKAIEKGTRFYEKYTFKGAGFRTNSSYLIFSNNSETREVKTNVVIGSDGPTSPVGKTFHLIRKRKFINGIQARLRIKNNNTVLFGIFNSGVWWVVPEDESSLRVGLALNSEYKSKYKRLFKRLMKSLQIKGLNFKTSFSLIPVFDPKQELYYNYKKKKIKVMLTGDAVGAVKQTSFGGIIPGLKTAVITEKLLSHDKKARTLHRKLWSELRVNLLIRRILDRMNMKDYKILKHTVEH